ncbi:MlaD family protein [Paracidobacterium acidisoli]|uniref:MlaD family protein n=1 Tax=Paracidobacterium acidisoli TaxID=2303751 RepID=UPI0033149610
MRWSQLKVGVLVLVAIFALLALIFLMTGTTGGFFTGKVTLHSYFENSAGLKIGAPVNLEGVTVGNVRSIRIVASHSPTPVEVVMKINKKYAAAIREDSTADLDTIGVLGDTVVDITSKFKSGSPVRDGDELHTTETPNLSDVIKSSQGTIEQLNVILAKVNSLVDALNNGKGSIGMLINDPTLYKKAVGTFDQLQSLVDQISNGKGSIGKLVSDDTLYNRANETIGKLDDIATRLDSGQGTVGKLMKDDTLYNNLRQSTENLNKLLAGINEGKGGLGLLAKDPQFAQKLNDTVTHLDSILNGVDSGQGTLGQLMKNRDLYDHSDEMIRNTNQLILAVRKDPKKYLTIHLKIF